MNRLVLVPDHFYNCPICGQPCDISEPDSYLGSQINGAQLQWPCQLFICLNPLAIASLHYYAHFVEKSAPHRIAFQEFSLSIGNRVYLFANNLKYQESIVKCDSDSKPLFFNFVIEPDFPDLSLLSKKVKTYITFS